MCVEQQDQRTGEKGWAWPFSKTPSLGQTWMSRIDDSVPLSGLTIPGTHDSSAYTYAVPFIQTQALDFNQQLNAGIRYFDLRCGLRNDVVEMVHGSQTLGLALDDVLSTLSEFLDRFPSEALIVQLKKDRGTERSSTRFSLAIAQSLLRISAKLRTETTTPTLGEVRGRIQLFRRYVGDNLDDYGIDVNKWVDNPDRPFTVIEKNGLQITIQDHYAFNDRRTLPQLLETKQDNVEELFDLASTNSDLGHWYLNYTSASEVSLFYQYPPKEVAVGGYWSFNWEEGINPRVRQYLAYNPGQKRFGIVAMDFPEVGADDLIHTLIRSNDISWGWSWYCYLLGLLLLAAIGLAVAALHFDSSWQPLDLGHHLFSLLPHQIDHT